MFVRVKNIKNKPYAYLVENEWTPWGSRQRVTKYLGKTHLLERTADAQAILPAGREAVVEAIAQELLNHGFTREGSTLNKEGISVNLSDKTVRLKGRKAVLGMNEGYLCDHTFSELHQLKASDPKEAASKALEAGLKLSPEQFVHLFEQIKEGTQ